MNIRCLVGKHECVSCSDKSGFWGECIHYHKRFGFISRQQMGRIIDKQIAERLIELNQPESTNRS